MADALQRAGLAPAAGSATDAATGYPQRVVHQQTGAVFTLLPAGEFAMGSPAGEAERRATIARWLVALGVYA